MSEDGNARPSRRYVALDIHKHYCVIAGVDREGRVLLPPVRVEHVDLEEWLKKKLEANDQVVIESTTNAWHVHDLLNPLVERVVVANPIKVKQIASARVKTDIRDTLILARLLAAIWFQKYGYRRCMCDRCGNCFHREDNWWRPIRRS